MANDLISFGVCMYVWKIVFIVLFFLVAIVVAYPWLLLIPIVVWWACISAGSAPKATEAGEAAAHGEATAPRPEQPRGTQARRIGSAPLDAPTD
jgi:hypothetical protein